MKTVNKVLIVGGGIAGLTTAIALHKKGIVAEIIEKHPSWSVYGVGIIQPSNMLRALKSIGLGDACLENGCGFNGWEFHDTKDNLLVRIPSENVAGEGYPPVNGITRISLHNILLDAVKAQGTSIRLGVTLSSWEDGSDGIEVVCSDGSREKYDLLIGADGAYSQIRSMFYGEEIKPQFTGQAVWRYNVEKPKGMDWGRFYYGEKSKAGLIPLSEDLMYLLLVTAEPGNPQMPNEKLADILRERLAEYSDCFIGSLVEKIVDSSAVVYRPLEVFAAEKPWHKGRVLLIGDAAHSGTPHLAEGAAMAIEDGVILADMLADSTELDSTLTAFAERRFDRVHLVYTTGLKIGEMEQAQWAGEDVDQDLMGKLLADAHNELMNPA